MRRILSVIFIAVFMINTGAVAFDNGAVCIGSDVKSDEKASILKIFGTSSGTPEVVISIDEVGKDFGEGSNVAAIGSKSVVCAYVNKLAGGSGIVVENKNITYVTPEMITECLITAGVKDVKVKIASPYDVSGSTSVDAALKAYEKITGCSVSDDARYAANNELSVMSRLGLVMGMQKSLQLINEIEKEVIGTKASDEAAILKIVKEQEKRFNISLEEADRNEIVYIMEKLGSTGLSIDTITAQQKYISAYVDDLSKTAYKDNIFRAIYNNIMLFLKKISGLFKGKQKS